MSNAQYVYDALTAAGLTPAAAGGVLGNLQAESGIDPNAVQPRGPGRGIAQWSAGGRWDALTRYAAGTARDPWALSTQTNYLIFEMHAMGVWAQLLQPGITVLQAATLVMDHFEMPADQSPANAAYRAGLGAQLLAGLTTPTPPGDHHMIAYVIPDQTGGAHPGDGVLAVSGAGPVRAVTYDEWHYALVPAGATYRPIDRAAWLRLKATIPA